MFTCDICIRPPCNCSCSDGRSTGRHKYFDEEKISRSVTLAIGIVAGLIDGDLNIQLLLGEPDEYKGERGTG